MRNRMSNHISQVIYLVVFLFFSSGTSRSFSLPGNGDKIVNSDCSINKAVFKREWRKYADINDSRVPSKSKHWEAQQYHKFAELYIQKSKELYQLECVMAVHALMRRDNKKTLDALNRNIKVNLIKSFIRLSYFTYTTINAAKGLGSSYANLFDPKVINSVKLASAVKTVRHYVPNKSKLEINTKTVSGKLTSLGLSGALELVENFNDPNAIAQSMVNDFNSKFLPSVKLSKEEINLLRNQRKFKDKLDKMLRKSYTQAKEWKKQTNTMKVKLKQYKAEMASWEDKEKERIKDMLIQNCKKKKRKKRREGDVTYDIEKWWKANESWYYAGGSFKSALPGFEELQTTYVGAKSKAVGIESNWSRWWSTEPRIRWSVGVKVIPYRTDAKVADMWESMRSITSGLGIQSTFVEKVTWTDEGCIRDHKPAKTWKGITTYSRDMTIFYKNCTIYISEITAPSRGEMRSNAVLASAKALVDRKRATPD